MKNITVTVDEEVHRRARIRAAELATSLSAVVKEFLIRFSQGDTDYDRRVRLEQDTLGSIRSFSASNRLGRDDVHDRHALR